MALNETYMLLNKLDELLKELKLLRSDLEKVTTPQYIVHIDPAQEIKLKEKANGPKYNN